MALVSAHNKTFGVRLDGFNPVAVRGWVLRHKAFVVTVAVADDDVSLVGANQELALLEPAVASVIVADVLLFLVQSFLGVAHPRLIRLHGVEHIR